MTKCQCGFIYNQQSKHQEIDNGIKIYHMLSFDAVVRPESDQIITIWDAVLLQLTEIEC
jgi:hypothetical protein